MESSEAVGEDWNWLQELCADTSWLEAVPLSPHPQPRLLLRQKPDQFFHSDSEVKDYFALGCLNLTGHRVNTDQVLIKAHTARKVIQRAEAYDLPVQEHKFTPGIT